MKPKHTIVVDFETYYDKGYTLTNMPMCAYVDSPKFAVIGVAIKFDHNPTEFFVPHDSIWSEVAEGRYRFLDIPINTLPWNDALVVAHNAQFDGYILEQYFGVHPARYFCTQMGARPMLATKLGSVSLAKVAEYFRIGAKGTEVINAKGKHDQDFTAEEFEAYANYCINDVNLTFMIYQILDAWYDRHDRTA